MIPAAYLDRINADKDYAGEVERVVRLIEEHRPGARTILDLGCGTGNHAVLLAEKGYSLFGIDKDDASIQIARSKNSAVRFEEGEIGSLNLGQTFDVVIALYNVLGCMTENDDVTAMLSTVSRHLVPGGIFIADFWYGPAFLHEPPKMRFRQGDDFTHVAEPFLFDHLDLVVVSYTLRVHDRHRPYHADGRYRYFFMPELDLFLKTAGLQGIACETLMTGEPPSITTREICLVARK